MVNILFKMPYASTARTHPEVAKSFVIPCSAKPPGRFPEILTPMCAGFWGYADPYLPWDQILTQRGTARNQQGRTPGRGPPIPTDRGNTNCKMEEAERNPLLLPT